MSDRLRILYAAGPGNVIGTYRCWTAGHDDPSQLSVTYSGQFYDLVRQIGARACVVSSCRTPAPPVDDEHITIVHRPIPFENASGVLYHLGQLWHGLRLMASAVRFRADVVVACSGTHWFLLGLLPLFGIRVVASLHCLLWRRRPTLGCGAPFFLERLNARFFRRSVSAIIAVSDDVQRQVEAMTGGRTAPIARFTPIYRRATFAGVQPPSLPSPRAPFRVLFAGRVERNKGVFELLEVARRLEALGRRDIEFDICGDGTARVELAAALAAAGPGLRARFRCHGHCDRDALRRMYAACHTVIVPTTNDFLEGFNKVVVEAVLAGRPVIASTVCPSLATVRPAVIEVPPDDVRAYGDAIVRLCDDRSFYESRRLGCVQSWEQFYDESHSWGATLTAVLLKIGCGQPAVPSGRWRAVRRWRLVSRTAPAGAGKALPATNGPKPAAQPASAGQPASPTRVSTGYAGLLTGIVLGVLAGLFGLHRPNGSARTRLLPTPDTGARRSIDAARGPDKPGAPDATSAGAGTSSVQNDPEFLLAKQSGLP